MANKKKVIDWKNVYRTLKDKPMIKNDKTFDDVYFNGLKEMFETCKWLIKQKDLSKRLKGFKEDKTKSP